MRVTKVNNIKHFKYEDRGGLIRNNNFKRDITRYLLKNDRYESIKLSLRDSLLNKKVNNSISEVITSFIEFLISKESEWDDFNKFKEEYSKNNNIKKDIEDSLSEKGKNEPYCINNLMENLSNVKNNEELLNRCSAIRDKLYKKINDKHECLIKSIRLNYLFSIDNNNSINFHSNKSEVLHKWMKEIFDQKEVNIFESKVEYLADKFQINVLCLKIKRNLSQIISSEDGNREIKIILNDHKKSIINLLKYTEGDSNEEQGFKKELNVYTNEVTKYIEHYFPITRKGAMRNRKIKNLNRDEFSNYINKNIKKLPKVVEYQLKNSLTQHIIKIGKFIHYYSLSDYKNGNAKWEWTQKSFTTDDLEFIKKREVFSRKIINMCTFATSNLRNIINSNEENDIITNSPFKNNISDMIKGNLNSKEIKKRLNLFIYNSKDFDINNLNQTELIEVLSELRSSISNTRNKIYHFSHENENNLLEYLFSNKFEKFDVINDELNSIGDFDFTNGYISKIMEEDINSIGFYLSEKFKSSNIFEFYEMEDIKKFNEFISWKLDNRNFPFAVSFKRILQRAKTTQTHLDDINWFFNLREYFSNENSETIIKNAESAVYNLLNIIYNNSFKGNFINNSKMFAEAVNTVKIKNQLENQHNSDKKGYKQVPDFKKGGSVLEYLSNIQSSIILNNAKNKGKDKTDFFSRFLLDVYKEGFIKYCNENQRYFKFILTPKFRLKDKSNKERSNLINQMEEELATYINRSIDKNEYDSLLSDGKYISFYGLLKLIDSRTINTFRNELIKYEQAMEEHYGDKDNYENFHKIINLCMFSVDRIPSSWIDIYEKESNWKKLLEPFVDFSNIENDEKFYYQGEKKVPVVRRQIELARKYGVYSCFKKIYWDIPKVNQEDIDKYNSIDIGKISQERQKMHEEWAKSKEKKAWLKKHKKDYIEKCSEIDNYNFLKNKIELFDLSMIQKLLMDIISKNVSYISLWERDFRFFIVAMDYFGLLNPHNIDQNGEIYKMNSSKALFDGIGSEMPNVANYRNIIRNNNGKTHEIISYLFLDYENFNKKDTDWVKFRINVAHMNYLTKNIGLNNLLEYLEKFRILFKYDRNIKNSVTKSFIEIFKRNNLDLDLRLIKDKIELENARNRKNFHLGGEVWTFSHSKDYEKLVENLILLR